VNLDIWNPVINYILHVISFPLLSSSSSCMWHFWVQSYKSRKTRLINRHKNRN